MKFSDSENIDPMGQDITDYCWSKLTDPEEVLERITEKMEKTISHMAEGKARQNVLTFLIQEEYRHSLDEHLDETDNAEGAGSPDATGYDERIAALEKKFSGKFGGPLENAEVFEIDEIDKAVGVGGRTLLHEAVLSNDLEEVVRLVRECNADTEVRDNFRQTPYKRALDLGYDEITEFLESLPH